MVNWSHFSRSGLWDVVSLQTLCWQRWATKVGHECPLFHYIRNQICLQWISKTVLWVNEMKCHQPWDTLCIYAVVPQQYTMWWLCGGWWGGRLSELFCVVLCITFVYTVIYTHTNIRAVLIDVWWFRFRFNVQHLSSDDCVYDKSKDYQNCSVWYCVSHLCTQWYIHTQTYEQFL